VSGGGGKADLEDGWGGEWGNDDEQEKGGELVKFLKSRLYS